MFSAGTFGWSLISTSSTSHSTGLRLSPVSSRFRFTFIVWMAVRCSGVSSSDGTIVARRATSASQMQNLAVESADANEELRTRSAAQIHVERHAGSRLEFV